MYVIIIQGHTIICWHTYWHRQYITRICWKKSVHSIERQTFHVTNVANDCIDIYAKECENLCWNFLFCSQIMSTQHICRTWWTASTHPFSLTSHIILFVHDVTFEVKWISQQLACFAIPLFIKTNFNACFFKL